MTVHIWWGKFQHSSWTLHEPVSISIASFLRGASVERPNVKFCVRRQNLKSAKSPNIISQVFIAESPWIQKGSKLWSMPWKELALEGMWGGKELGRVEGGETKIRIHCVRKKINKRKKAKREMSLMLMKLNRERKMVWKWLGKLIF